jgi:hypothetical protein
VEVKLAINVADILSPRRGTEQNAVWMLLGIHSTNTARGTYLLLLAWDRVSRLYQCYAIGLSREPHYSIRSNAPFGVRRCRYNYFAISCCSRVTDICDMPEKNSQTATIAAVFGRDGLPESLSVGIRGFYGTDTYPRRYPYQKAEHIWLP